ncbi:MAG: acyl-CoA/acyl-ACP dehydrogenase [Pricia sp.]|nr:acyl-CoA/acyl-ACP dehydrogenase [Pricia sp.]
METTIKNGTQTKNWIKLIEHLGPQLSTNGRRHDNEESFVAENYELIKQHGLLSAMMPNELGGYGIAYREMCEILKKIAHYCPSTALALSMHQHLLAANIWKYKHNKGGEEVLKRVADKNLILISTGAHDWLESNGTMEKVEGGFLVSSEKHFASQSAIGNILVTSAPYYDPENGWQVLHFGVPMNSIGVKVLDNWYTLGMRGTGSQTVKLEKVFVPETSIVLIRPKGEYHMFWNVVLTVAMPLIMSVYVGIAEKAVKITLGKFRKTENKLPHIPFVLGEMYNQLTLSQVLLKDMIALTNNFDFLPKDETGVAILTRKTLVAEACKATVAKAMEAFGGQGFYRVNNLERLFRDVQAGNFHPLPEKQQQHFTGNFLLKNEFMT